MIRTVRAWKDETAASAAEYALILALIGSAPAFASIALGQSIGGAMNNAAACIQDSDDC